MWHADAMCWLTQQVKKLTEKVERCRRDVESTRSAYTTSLNELNSYNAKYMEDMNEVFSRTQQFEAKRLAFFKNLLYDYHACVDATQMTQYVSSLNTHIICSKMSLLHLTVNFDCVLACGRLRVMMIFRVSLDYSVHLDGLYPLFLKK